MVALATEVPGQVVSVATAPLLYPAAMAFDSAGNLYLVETNRHVVDKVDASGALTVVAGNGVQGFAGDGGAATQAELDSPAESQSMGRECLRRRHP